MCLNKMKLSGTWTNYNSYNSPIPKGMAVLQVAAGLSSSVWMHVFENVTLEQANVRTVNSKTHGILQFINGGWLYYPFAGTALGNLGFVDGMTCDRTGSLWLNAPPSWIAYFDGQTRRLFRPGEQGLPLDFGISSILTVDLNNNVWVSMIPVGVFRFDNDSQRWFEFQDPAISNAWVTSAAVDGRGQMWFVVQSEKETRILAQVADHLEERDRFDVGFTREQVVAFVFDRNGRQWMAWSDLSGVSKLGIWASKEPGQPWAKFTTRNSPLPDNHITSLTVDKRNRIWVGTTEGFAVFDGDSVADWSMIIPGAKHGPLAMANVPGPVAADQKTAFTVIADYATVDSRGRLWARSFNGVSVFDEAEPDVSD